MLNIASSDSLLDEFTLISYLTFRLVLDDKVCESSTSSNRVNLSNSLNNSVCTAFFLYGEIIIIIIIIKALQLWVVVFLEIVSR